MGQPRKRADPLAVILIWTANARRNLEEQLEYVADDNPTAADRLSIEVERQTDILANHPRIGRPGRLRGTRELVIDRTPYVAVYRIRRDLIEIVRLLHGAQVWPPTRSSRRH
jgi:toxin ParE1/3/4